ncbi:MAG: hypothetical protein E7194_07055 [Erysipelotrichaceae bacterium]|nr:hypothetical protein [Erysipelotrichaceae bacterium]
MIEATGEHSYGEWTVTKEASCTERGKQERECTVCGKKVTEDIPQLAHVDDNEWVIVTAASATSAGQKATHCELCGREMQTESFELSMEEKNAIRKAESYLSFMAFSRKGLIEQLEFEGFSTESSTMAVDALNVDWNKQAALKAKSYLDMMSFSRSGLIDQLLYEGFTRDQAEYGVSEAGY